MGVWIPKGVPVTSVSDGELMDPQEYQFFLANLEERSFSGLILLNVQELDQKYMLLMRAGGVVTIYEVVGDEEYTLTPIAPPVFSIRTMGYPFKVVYSALAPDIVEVLSLAFTFKEQSRNYPVTSEGDYRKVMESMYERKITGIIKKSHSDDSIVLFKGSPLTDVLVDDYIDVRCSPKKVKEFEEEVVSTRGFLTIWGEEHEKVQEMFDKLERRLSKVRLMTIKAEGGFLDQTIKVAPEILADWRSSGELSALILNAVGKAPIHLRIRFSAIRPKDMGSIDFLGIPRTLLKRLNLIEGEEVAVEPIYEEESE